MYSSLSFPSFRGQPCGEIQRGGEGQKADNAVGWPRGRRNNVSISRLLVQVQGGEKERGGREEGMTPGDG